MTRVEKLMFRRENLNQSAMTKHLSLGQIMPSLSRQDPVFHLWEEEAESPPWAMPLRFPYLKDKKSNLTFHFLSHFLLIAFHPLHKEADFF